MAKFIVTGGAGFIGSNIVERLVKEKHVVKVIDNLSTGKLSNLKQIKNGFHFVKGDICNYNFLLREFKGYDFILHQAALCSVPRSINNPASSNKNNIDGTLNVLLAAKENKIKRVVLASSSSVYGEAKANFKSEDLPTDPLSPYALTKLTNELYAKIFHRIYGLETVALRYFNVFGPRQDPESQYAAVIPKFISLMLLGQRPVIFGDGEQARDFTYVENNVSANILAAKARLAPGETINIACGESNTLNELVNTINEELGTKIKPIYQKARVGDIKLSKAKITKAQKILNYKVEKKFKDGLRETIAFYKQK